MKVNTYTLKITGLIIISCMMCLPVIWPLLQPHFFHLQDYTHIARLAELERGIHDGQLPVRWSENLGYGYGMPQFSFYGPLFYYEAYCFRLIQVPAVWAVKLAVILQVLVSFYGLYRLGSALWGKWGGFISAVAGTYIPYRAVDMYVRGAFAELTGITFIILSLLALYRFAEKPNSRKAVLAAAAMAGIVVSHNLMALISAPFLVIFGIYGLWHFKRINFKMLLQFAGIGLLTAGLAAFYAIPALVEKGYTQADQLTTGFSNYTQHFVYIRQLWQSAWGYGGVTHWGPNIDGISFEVGKVQLILWFLTGAGMIYFLIKKKIFKESHHVVVLSGLLIVALFMSILKSKFIWDAVPVMAFIQFPWRFLSLAIVFIALLSGAVMTVIPPRFRLIACLFICAGLIASQVSHFVPEAYLRNDAALYYTDANRIQTEMSGVIPDFLPKTAQEKEVTPLLNQPRFRFSVPIKDTVEVNRSNEFLIGLPTHPALTFTAAIFDFPGWTMYVDGKAVPHHLSPQGFITQTLPSTTTDTFISGRFMETPLRTGADLTTILGIITGISLLSIKQKKGHYHA